MYTYTYVFAYACTDYNEILSYISDHYIMYYHCQNRQVKDIMYSLRPKAWTRVK